MEMLYPPLLEDRAELMVDPCVAAAELDFLPFWFQDAETDSEGDES